jgi:diaminohydroxyphosphoribosylaminopyrimidine deaminase/5-amino-6-(5-phosphoribosylamino)uracil reductase
MLDPNPNVKGGGGRLLAKRGVTFESGLLENEARHLNAGFVKMAEEGRPLVTLKLASSLDGGIATRSGDSKWITGTPARREAHRLRAGHDAVVVGGATVVADNPELTVRHVRGVNPARIVLDPDLVTSPDARWLENDGVRRILVTARKSSAQKTAAWRAHGAEVWTLATDKNGGIQLKDFVKQAGEAGLLTLLVEGGGRLAGSFLAAGLVDRVRIFTAPLLLGGEARRWTGGLSVNQVDEAPRLKNVRLKRLGTDWQIEGDIEVHGNGEAACSRAS